ncbi:MAG: TolC family protein [Lewinellaceae bacterium]|nr:TolC family protein [Saprospiraceae bacterium]MCB9339357.1 TolC family protein [Lewinellaceae bacterium]
MLLTPRFVLLFSFLVTGTQAWAQTLQFYLDAAFATNPAVQENRNLSAIAELEISKTKAIYKMPEFSATANLLYAPVVEGVGYDEAITNGALYSGQFNLNMPLFTGPQFDAQVKNSLVNQEIYHQNTALSQHDLARQVTEQFILTWQNQERIATTQRLLDLLAEQEKVVRTFAENAILSQSDVLFFTIEKENQQLALRDFQMAYRQGLSSLYLLCGKVDTTYTELQQPDIQLKADTAGMSNFLKIYGLDSLLATSNQELSEMKYRPQVSAFANYGLNAIMLKDIYKKFGFSVGVNFSMTIFDGNQRELTRQQTQLAQMTSGVQRDFQTKQVEQQRLIALQQINLLDGKIEAVQRQLADYETLLKFYRERIVRGELSVNDYMNTVKSFAAAQADFISLKTSRLLLVNNYNYWNW